VPVRPKAEHGEIEHGIAENDRVLRPKPPEDRVRRTGLQRRLNKGLRGERESPEIKRGAEPASERQQRQRRDHAVDVANLQRQAGRDIDAVAIPPDVIGKPIGNTENTEEPPQPRLPRLFQAPAGEREANDHGKAAAHRAEVQPAIRSECVQTVDGHATNFSCDRRHYYVTRRLPRAGAS
jgi:hypothetical protein